MPAKIKMTRNIQFRNRALDEGQVYEVNDDELKELALYGSHVVVPPAAKKATPADTETAAAKPDTEAAASRRVKSPRRPEP